MKFISFLLGGAMLLSCAKADAGTKSFAPFFVGALHKKWRFTSDHLPIGAKVNEVRIASWNVLNDEYLRYIIEDGQGLNGSLITQLAKIRASHDLSKREQVVFRQCMAMTRGEYKRSLIGLVETSHPLFHYLQHHLPPGWKCLFSPSLTHQEDVFLYDSRRLLVVDSTIVPYPGDTPKVVFLLKVEDKKSKKNFAVFLTHVPGGGPSGLIQMAGIVKSLFDPALETVVMGDMNASPGEVAAALQSEGLQFIPSPTEYPSHINTLKEAAWYDAFYVYSPLAKCFLKTDSKNHLLPHLTTHIHRKKIKVFGVEKAARLLKPEFQVD
jgi:hypothetical protein